MGVFVAIAVLIILWKMNIQQIGIVLIFLSALGVGLYFLLVQNAATNEKLAREAASHCKLRPGEMEEWKRDLDAMAPGPWKRLEEAAGPHCL